MEGIRDRAVYAKESEARHLPGLGLSGAASSSALPPLQWAAVTARSVGTSWKRLELDGNASIQLIEPHGIS